MSFRLRLDRVKEGSTVGLGSGVSVPGSDHRDTRNSNVKDRSSKGSRLPLRRELDCKVPILRISGNPALRSTGYDVLKLSSLRETLLVKWGFRDLLIVY